MKIYNSIKPEKLIIIPKNIVKEFILNDFVKDSYITDIGFFPEAKHHHYERKDGTETNIIIYCVKGKGLIILENKTIELFENQLFIIPKNTPHHYKSDEEEPWSIFWVHFEYKNLSSIISVKDLQKSIPVQLILGAKIQKAFNDCFTILENIINFENFTYCSCILNEIIGLVFLSERLSSEPKKKKSNESIELTIEFMNKHIHENITLTKLCQIANFSKPRFITIFKQYTGRSPIEYFIIIKLQKCCYELDYTSKSVKEIGELYGFFDQFYFSRIFKKYIGKSPEQYRFR